MKVKENIKYNIFIISATLFIILKLIRNTAIGYEDDSQGGIWNIIPLAIFLYSIALIIYNIFNKIKIPVYIKISIIYTVCSMFNSLLNIGQFDLKYFYIFIMISCFSSVLIVFYYLSLNKLSQKQINISLFCIFFIILFTFISIYKIRTENLIFFVANIYFALSIFPLFLIFSKNKIFDLLLFSIITLSVLFSGKRTAFIAYFVFLFIYNFILSFINKNLIKFFRAFFIFIIISVIFIYLHNFILNNYNINLFERMTNIVSDGGSGRNEIYNDVWNGFKNSPFADKVLGHGIYSVKRDFGHGHAHNDFLDILYHYGLCPCILFILFYISLFWEGLLMIKYKYKKSHIFIGGLFISIILSMFSIYCVGLEYIVGGMTFLGISLGQWELYKNTLRGKNKCAL